MYCRYCGKELPNDSNFCPSCGKKQKKSKEIIFKFATGLKIIEFTKKYMIAVYAYFFWVLLNLTLYITSDKYSDCGQRFYPFDMPLSYVIQGGIPGAIGMKIPPTVEFFGRSLNCYDFTEFFTYTLLFPMIVLGLVRLIHYIITLEKHKSSVTETSNIKTKEVKIDFEQSEDSLESQDITVQKESFDYPMEQDFTRKEHINTFELFIKRFFATTIDKVLIMVLAGFLIFSITSIYPFYAEELGTYSALFHMSTLDIYNAAIGSVIKNFPNDMIAQHKTEIDSCYLDYIWLDICFTLQFVAINLIYYYFSERKWSASLCKHYYGLILVSTKENQEGKVISHSQVLLRASIFLVLMIAMILLRWLLGINYWGVIIFFFLLLDFPILLTGKSMIDLLSSTKLIAIDKQRTDNSN